MGGDGSLLSSTEGLEYIPAFDINPVDTTAAGDAFVGGFAVALAEGKSFVQAARFGNASGALAATRLGAQTSLPDRGEVDALISSV